MVHAFLRVLFTAEGLEDLQLDLDRRFLKYGERSLFWRARYYWRRSQYRTLLFYRLMRAARHSLVRRVCELLYHRSSARSGVEIYARVVGGGVIFPHAGPIRINAEKIGRNLYVLHGVSIGHDYKTGLPTIGDNVFVGVGSIVLGKISIGDNAVIGAGSVVLRDVPPNSVAAGNPARVVKTVPPGVPLLHLGWDD